MRLNGEISYLRNEEVEEEEAEERVPLMSLSPPPPSHKLVVGYALTSKKVKSFLQPKLEGLARKKGIIFVAIDHFQPLLNQGPFDIVLHKLTGKEWQQILEVAQIVMHLTRELFFLDLTLGFRVIFLETLFLVSVPYSNYIDLNPFTARSSMSEAYNYYLSLNSLKDYLEKHPEVTVLDPPAAIKHLHNRQSMLQDVADLNLSDCYGKVGVPRQLVVTKDPSSIPDAVCKAELSLPLVVKPLVADGSAKSHELSLAFDEVSLSKLDPPLVLQEFVNHGGVLFKVYIVGEAIKVVRRFSLPDVNKREPSNNTGVFQFPRVSCAAASADDAELDPSIAGKVNAEDTSDINCLLANKLPPRPLLENLARELRHRLGLRLFNIDIIREHGTKDRFYVIDINYFPERTLDIQLFVGDCLHYECLVGNSCLVCHLYLCHMLDLKKILEAIVKCQDMNTYSLTSSSAWYRASSKGDYRSVKHDFQLAFVNMKKAKTHLKFLNAHKLQSRQIVMHEQVQCCFFRLPISNQSILPAYPPPSLLFHDVFVCAFWL
ncbi:hypothetical protein ZIOFF_046410 [Zingiber officinale]|uniref:Uncharacterized protein n=1 Tax=Zingiber officinale TaxID=94328 RepID=A0A8J5G2Q8_ZINOF|nr:hypothetical protein ZIOFF_046410 [Zingiber officinale]